MWNICGIANDESIKIVNFFNQRYKPAVMVIIEPKISGGRTDIQIDKLNFLDHY